MPLARGERDFQRKIPRPEHEQFQRPFHAKPLGSLKLCLFNEADYNNFFSLVQLPMPMTPLEELRHSSSHVLAAALLRLFPDAKLDIGPPTDAGFYYDVDLGPK